MDQEDVNLEIRENLDELEKYQRPPYNGTLEEAGREVDQK
jgi:hypothetical protein